MTTKEKLAMVKLELALRELQAQVEELKEKIEVPAKEADTNDALTFYDIPTDIQSVSLNEDLTATYECFPSANLLATNPECVCDGCGTVCVCIN